jgi:AbrB family looped-hinge helix DNA binding protein
MQSVVSVRGQTVIPKEVRKALGIKPGSKLNWIVKDRSTVVFVVPEDPVRALRGILKGHGTYADWLRERNEERNREREQDERGEARWRATSSTHQR